jgi:CHAT domain-containing protein/CHASE2 domain-containing sensor protein/tetratricopeptide (TPR) repeat protein
MRLTPRSTPRLRRAIRVLVLSVALAATVWAARMGGLLQGVELAAQDLLVAAHAGQAQSQRIVLVLADEQDIARFGWPLSDDVLADAILRLDQAGAAAIGIDIYRDRPVGQGAERLDRVIDLLSNLYWVFRLGEGDQPGIAPPPRLAGSPRAVMADLVVDEAGVARRALLLATDPRDQRNVPSLGTAIALHVAGTRLRAAGEDRLAFGRGTVALLGEGSGAYARVDASGYQTLMDFAGGADAFRAIGLGALLDGQFDEEFFRGRAVLVGTAALSVRDRFPTPVASGHTDATLMPGIVVHAHVADQLLRLAEGSARSLSPLPAWIGAPLVMAAGVGGGLIVLGLGAVAAIAATALALAAVAGAASLAFTHGILLPAVPAGLALLLAVAAGVWLLHGLGSAERRRLRASFAHYLDERIIRDLAESDTPPSFHGERRRITVLFTDLENFTHLAETREPAELAALLNRYFGGIARAITEGGGLLTQFTGDGVVALFGAPQSDPHHAARAVEAALAIDAFAEAFSAARRAESIPWGGTRIGIATGPALVGHLGTEARLHYGAVGGVLVTAARLEALNRTLGTRIAVAGDTARDAGIANFQPLGRHAVKGRAEMVDVFTPRGLASGSIATRIAAGLLLTLLAVPAMADAARDRALARDWLGRGTASFQSGDLAAASRAWSEAIRLCRTAGDPALEAEALARRGEVLRLEGKYRAASEDLSAALARAEAARDPRLVAATAGALGNLAFLSRRTVAAEPLLERARNTARQAGDAGISAAVANDLGNLHALTDRPASAAAFYAEGAREALRAGDPALAATAEVNAARLASRTDPRAAAALLSRAIDRLAALPQTVPVGQALVGAGHVAFGPEIRAAQPLLPAARRAFAEAERIAAATGSQRLLAEALAGQGRMAERAGDLANAQRLTDRAREAALRDGTPELRFRLDWQAGRVARAARQDAAALEHYRRAIAGLDSFRADIPIAYNEGESSFRAGFGPLYQEAADLLLRRAATDPAAAETLVTEARAALERLRAAELQDYFRDPCVTQLQARARPVERVAADTAVLYPVILPDRLELLLGLASRTVRVSVPVSAARLRAETEALRLALERRATFEFLEPAGRLHALLVAPVEQELRAARITTLVVVPDGVLRTIPFAALHDGRGFLAERFAVATVPGFTLFDPRPIAAARARTLAAGMAEGGADFAALPAVPDELAAIRALRDTTVLLDRNFTRDRFVRTLRGNPFAVVHVASHGEVGADPSRSFVRAHDGPISIDQLEAALAATRFREEGIELLVLSACQTAAGDDRAALGLAGLAVKAGARSALASLWFVSDRASAQLVAEFYAALARGMGKAQALAAAQRSLIADPLLAHPAYWSPFLLIGNWL